MSERVKIAISDHVATVTLNRADKRNAVDTAMFDALIAATDSIGSDSSVRAVVLHGDGHDFCAGVDISVFAGEGIGATVGERMKPRTASGANYFQSAAMCWRDLPVPVIAALHGSAFGAGFQIAMGADIRYAAPNTRMSVMEIKWGLVPDMSITQTLRDLLPLDVAKELAFTGRVLSGLEARELGLVTHVADDPRAAALRLAEEIAGKSPSAIRAGKRLFEESWHADAAVGLGLEASLQAGLIGSPNQIEAVKANFANRPPKFADE